MQQRQRFCRRLQRAINQKTASINTLALAATDAPTAAIRRMIRQIRQEQIEHRRTLRAIRNRLCSSCNCGSGH